MRLVSLWIGGFITRCSLAALMVLFAVVLAHGAEPVFQVRTDRTAQRGERPLQWHVVWIFFTDKGVTDQADYQEEIVRLRRRMSPRTLERRAKRSAQRAGLDVRDLPVPAHYVEAVRRTGVQIRTISKWFNGVSGWATEKQRTELKQLPFVRSVEPVKRMRRSVAPQLSKRRPPLRKPVGEHLEYGASYDQLQAMRVPELHDQGLSGRGVRVCLLDSGFDGYRTHEALAHIQVVAEWDFVAGEENADGDDHGTEVLSVIGGYTEGHLIGPAYGAEYLLARTEDTSQETPIEEDYWIAGIEWADSLGVDVVNSSVGYNIWDEGAGTSYTPADLDGNTARITIAADWAAERGITVVSAAGNEGDQAWRYVLVPADGDNVIAVGASDVEGNVIYFSSRGPTADGRIKPDVVAPGIDIVVGTWDKGGSMYSRLPGTSFSASLIAGVAALLLEAHPEWGPRKIREALRRSGHRALNPNNEVGWGLVDAVAANHAERSVYGRVVDDHSGAPISLARVQVSSGETRDSSLTSSSGHFLFMGLSTGEYALSIRAPRYVQSASETVQIPGAWEPLWIRLQMAPNHADRVYNDPNPVGAEGTVFSFPFDQEGRGTVRIYTPSGELVWWAEEKGIKDQQGRVFWSGRNMHDERVGNGVYFYSIEAGALNVVRKLAVVY